MHATRRRLPCRQRRDIHDINLEQRLTKEAGQRLEPLCVRAVLSQPAAAPRCPSARPRRRDCGSARCSRPVLTPCTTPAVCPTAPPKRSTPNQEDQENRAPATATSPTTGSACCCTAASNGTLPLSPRSEGANNTTNRSRLRQEHDLLLPSGVKATEFTSARSRSGSPNGIRWLSEIPQTACVVEAAAGQYFPIRAERESANQIGVTCESSGVGRWNEPHAARLARVSASSCILTAAMPN